MEGELSALITNPATTSTISTRQFMWKKPSSIDTYRE